MTFGRSLRVQRGLIDRKMSRGGYLELLRGALLTMNVDHAQARGAGYNRLRRFLPTMGLVCGLQPSNQQAVANWQEIPGAGGPQPLRKSKATWSMGVHYACQRVIHSAAFKHALVQLNAQGLVARDAWTWPELAQMNESFGPLEAPWHQFLVPPGSGTPWRVCYSNWIGWGAGPASPIRWVPVPSPSLLCASAASCGAQLRPWCKTP